MTARYADRELYINTEPTNSWFPIAGLFVFTGTNINYLGTPYPYVFAVETTTLSFSITDCYKIYLYKDSSGLFQLEISTTARVMDSELGYYVKTGDRTRKFIALGASTFGFSMDKLLDTTNADYNTTTIYSALLSDTITNSALYTEVSSDLRANFLHMENDKIDISLAGSYEMDTVADQFRFGLGSEDVGTAWIPIGSDILDITTYGTCNNIGEMRNLAMARSFTISADGYSYITLIANKISGTGNATVKGAGTISQRTTLSVMRQP